MNYLKRQLWAKFAATVLSVFLVGTAVIFLFATILFGTVPELQLPKQDYEEKLYKSLLSSYAASLWDYSSFSDDNTIKGLDALDGGNIQYSIVKVNKDETGTLQIGDYTDDYTVLYTNDDLVSMDSPLYSASLGVGRSYDYNTSSYINALHGSSIFGGRLHNKKVIKNDYQIYMSVREHPKSGLTLKNGTSDYTYKVAHTASLICSFRQTCGFWLAGSTILFLICFIFLLSAAGWRKEDDSIHLRWTDKIPPCFYALVTWIIICMIGFTFSEQENLSLSLMLGISLTGGYMIGFFVLAFFVTSAVKIKLKSFWRYTLVYYILKPFVFLFQMIRTNVPLYIKAGLLFFILTLVEILMFARGETFFLFKVFEFAGMIVIIYQMTLIKKGGQRIASGDYSQMINTNHMCWEFKKHAEDINNVGNGISLAVAERMKSEHFKTELITNVSHDIKTPLTSIINYVDLIKKENISDPTLQEYIDVLDRQSSRLKKLIEDLIEASKASTGNLSVNLELCDAAVMLTQIVGEFEDRANANHLELIVGRPDEPLKIMVDGRHLWRIIDNLMSNICKYAQPDTRVYINIEAFNGMVIMTFRNTSKYPLNISSEELMERFVRGDSSRNTEGNGLGLSIAQSLTSLMDGNMAIQIDGDLFKAIVSFPQAKPTDSSETDKACG